MRYGGQGLQAPIYSFKIPAVARHTIVPMPLPLAKSTGSQTESDSSKERRSFIGFVSWILWRLVCVASLGFAARYRERLRLFEGLYDIDDTDYKPWSTLPIYSDRGYKHNSIQTLRQKQQEEWDRLNITVSVITATSAAALAIQAINPNAQVYWLVTAFYSIAFGLSLEGIILITHMTISAGGSSDEGIARLARGILVSTNYYRAPKLTAFIMALPAIFATYSSLFLLLGLVAMVVGGPGEGVGTQSKEYILLSSFARLVLGWRYEEDETPKKYSRRKETLQEHLYPVVITAARATTVVGRPSPVHGAPITT
ncbi:unnamed protein product [Rhizoctonia solani]|nr:unnamed protein product [Rhizoctonia solani]